MTEVPPLLGIETEFTIIAPYKVANLAYRRCLTNPRFVSSKSTFVDENLWMLDVLYLLDEKRKRNQLVWAKWHKPPTEFKTLAKKYLPSVLFLAQALRIRRLLYCVAGSQKGGQELQLYTMDTWC